jgi:NAD+ synthase
MEGNMITDIAGLLVKVCNDIRSRSEVAVLGMSGGADSTLVALLCKEALGKEHVYSVHMPYNDHDHGFFNDRSRKTAEKLGVKIILAPIGKIADEINGLVSKCLVDNNLYAGFSKVNAGNARSRARMTVLYGISHHLNDYLGAHNYSPRVRVVGTGNLSEDYIGYDTKGGDALCDFFPIGELFKSEVFQLLDFFRDRGDITEDMIDRVPSAGLWDGQSDEAELGHTYNAMEPSIRNAHRRIGGVRILTDLHIDEFVKQRHLANKHKHEAPEVLSLREFCD